MKKKFIFFIAIILCISMALLFFLSGDKEIHLYRSNISTITVRSQMEVPISLDKALIRRFDATVSFNRYSKEDLTEIADSILTTTLKRSANSRQDMRLFNKILNNLDAIPLPGDLKQIIKTAIAFSDESNEYDYLRKIYLALNDNPDTVDIQKLKESGYTTREIEILSRIPRSSVSRKLKES